MRVAFCSSDGKLVDTHFGHARHFYLYDVSPGIAIHVGAKEISPYCNCASHGEPHPPRTELLEQVCQDLSGCERIYVTKIGDVPAENLRSHGIEPIVSQGYVHQILAQLTEA